MIPLRLRVVATVALVAAVIVVGMWCGEGLTVPVLLDVALGSAAAGVGFAIWRDERRTADGVASLVAVTFLLGWAVGRITGLEAFDRCVSSGNAVLAELGRYRAAHGGYPASLAELPGRDPCRRVLRGTLLEYERTAGGYRVRFGDDDDLHVATHETKGFVRRSTRKGAALLKQRHDRTFLAQFRLPGPAHAAVASPASGLGASPV